MLNDLLNLYNKYILCYYLLPLDIVLKGKSWHYLQVLQIEVFPELTHWLRTRSHLVRVFRVNRWSHDQWTKSIKSLKPLLIAYLRMARKHYKWMNKSLFFQWTCTRSLICILDVLQIKVKAQTSIGFKTIYKHGGCWQLAHMFKWTENI